MMVPVAFSTTLGLGLLYFPVRSALLTTIMAGFVISMLWTQMLAAYSRLRQKLSATASGCTCYVCSLSCGAYQMMLTTAGTLCNAITDIQVKPRCPLYSDWCVESWAAFSPCPLAESECERTSVHAYPCKI